MKRLVFCFDGTWNHLGKPNPTNVVITAQSITPAARDGTVQIIHYDPGVGTGRDDHWRGGVLGEGLIDKIAEAYTFLVFNYEPGDELFVFGFSRGAFTARAFVGFVRLVGILQRRHAARIPDAIALYHEHKPGDDAEAATLHEFRLAYSPELCVSEAEDAWRVARGDGYARGAAPILRIKYLGVWDTVAALGVPSDVIFAKWANRGERYFDSDLTRMVVSGRHAVSIDEDRVSFEPTLWPNFEQLNADLGYQPLAADAPYQQHWWPGDHGSVGGGGDVRGLSDGALDWVLSGATRLGLEIDRDRLSPLFQLAPDPFAALANTTATDPSLADRAQAAIMTHRPRAPGPERVEEVSEAAQRRWRADPQALHEHRPYRPETLSRVAAALDAEPAKLKPQADHPPLVLPPDRQPRAGALYRVVYNDQLGKLAETVYGHAAQKQMILDANPTVTDADRIYVGQILYLPPPPAAESPR